MPLITPFECNKKEYFHAGIYRQQRNWDGWMAFAKRSGLVVLAIDELCAISSAIILEIPGVLAGNRNTDGTFINREDYVLIWSSSDSGEAAWGRYLSISYLMLGKSRYAKVLGLSVIMKSK